MAAINPNPVASAQPVLVHFQGDDPLKRRIRAELIEVAELLKPNKSRLELLIADWMESFQKELRHPDSSIALRKFLPVLEEIFKEPNAPHTPFAPSLFDESQPAAVRYLIRRMKDPQSVFFSNEIAQAAPPPPPPPAAMPAGIVDLQEAFALIAAIQAERDQKDPHALGRAEILVQNAEAQPQAPLEGIARMAHQAFGQIQADIQELNAADRAEGDALLAVVAKLKDRIQEHQNENRHLQMRLNNAHQKLGELERANIELTIEVNRLKESINRQKEEWLSELIGGIALLALSVGITWASGGSLPPGTSVQIFKTGQGVPMLGITTPL